MLGARRVGLGKMTYSVPQSLFVLVHVRNLRNKYTCTRRMSGKEIPNLYSIVQPPMCAGPVCYEKPENEGTCCSTQDAAVIAYGSLSMLRQQLRPSWLVHGIINSAGGRFASLNPLEPTTHETELLFYFRTPTREELSVLLEKAEACFKAAAVATGCHFRIEQKAKTYENVVTSPLISELFLTNANKCLGLQFAKATNNFSASTDMGNVSHVVPSIHPLYSIGGAAVNHTKAFTAATNTPRAHQATLSVAKAMALTGLDLMWKDTCST